MTARTSQVLADALRAAGLEDMAMKAEADYYHDFLSPDPMCAVTLANELSAVVRDMARPLEMRTAAKAIRDRHLNGEFDADEEESSEWAEGPEGQDAMRRLMKGE